MKNKKIIFTGLLVVLILIPSIPALSAKNNTDDCIQFQTIKEKGTWQTESNEPNTKYFLTDIIQIIFGTIQHPRITELGSSRVLVFHAEQVFVIGCSISYDGAESITQWICDEEVRLSWDAIGPDFRGLITDNVIIGRQKHNLPYRLF